MKQDLLPFDERKKNIPSIDNLVQRLLSIKSNSQTILMNYSVFDSQVNNTQFPKERQKVCLKEPLKKRIKFGTVIPKSLKMNAINTIITQKNKDDFDNHQILLKERNKNIKGVLNSIIQMKKKLK